MHPINEYNAKVYSKGLPPQLPDFFVKLPSIQEAIFNFLEQSIRKSEISICELASGNNLDRWQQIKKIETSKRWSVTLTDFTSSALPDIENFSNKSFSFKTRELDLLNITKSFEKYDVILTTYGFDSIWFPEDAHYEKSDGEWKKSLYKPSSSFPIIEKQSIEILPEPFGSEIETYYKNQKEVSINFPGGLIKIVENFLSDWVTEDGVFVSGDIVSERKEIVPDFQTVPGGALYKKEDYFFSEWLLNKMGYNAGLINVLDFLEEYSDSGKIPFALPDHYFLIVKQGY